MNNIYIILIFFFISIIVYYYLNHNNKINNNMSYKKSLIHEILNELKLYPINYKEFCNKGCMVDDDVYKNEKFKLPSNSIMFNDDFLSLVSKKINFNDNYSDYIIKETVNKDTNIIFIGDIHSSLHSFIQLINTLIHDDILNNDYKLKENNKIVFTGDLIDRGPYGMQILLLLFLLVYVNNKGDIIYIKGNHKTPEMYNQYGFGTELENENTNSNIKIKIKDIIHRLPMAYFVKKNLDENYYQFCHGGIDELMIKTDEIKNFLIYSRYPTYNVDYKVYNGFLWSDFTEMNTPLEGINGNRGINKIYGKDSIRKILDYNNVKCILSGHQDLTPIGVVRNNKKGIFLNLFSDNFEIDDVYNGENNELLMTPIYNYTKIDTSEINVITLSSATISKDVMYVTYGKIIMYNDKIELNKIPINYKI